MSSTPARPAHGALLLVIAAAAGTALSIRNYLDSQAIGHSLGALAVLGSTAVMTLIALAMLRTRLFPRWLRAVLLVLLLLDVLATAIAAWFLEASLLLACMAVALLAWLLHVGFGPRHHPVQAGSAA